MFCTNCGKPTEGDSTLCSSCIAVMRAQEENKASAVEIQNQPETQPQTDVAAPVVESAPLYASATAPSNQKLGLGPAIAATVISEVGAMLAYIFFLVSTAVPVAGILLSLFIAIPMAIVALILGIKSIICAKNAVGKKPIATLILGIVSVASAAAIVIIFFLTIFMGALTSYLIANGYY